MGTYVLTCGKNVYTITDIKIIQDPNNNYLVEIKDPKITLDEDTTDADKLNGIIFSGKIEITGSTERRSENTVHDLNEIKQVQWKEWRDWSHLNKASALKDTIYIKIKKDMNYKIESNAFLELPHALTCADIPQ